MDCHQNRIQRHQHLPLVRLFTKFRLHTSRESKNLDRLFNERLDTAAYGKLIRMSIRNAGFTYTKPYLRRHMPQLSDEDRTELAESINNAAWIYDNIGMIQSNLIQVSPYTTIDIRRLSMTDLYQAKDLSWCHQYAELLKGRGKRKPDELAYTEDQFNDLVNAVMQHPCFTAVDGDPSCVRSLGGRLQRTLLKRMRHDF